MVGPRSPYPWDYWPHDDGRAACGYVGLTNLGATCYMASCMQHLYMMPQARLEILRAKCDPTSKHQATLHELQRMFAYLLVRLYFNYMWYYIFVAYYVIVYFILKEICNYSSIIILNKLLINFSWRFFIF